MTSTSDQPADTTMLRIVHDAPARERARAAGEALDVFDRMSLHHDAITPAVASARTAALALAADGSLDATRRTRDALAALAVVLLPHLQDEEDHAMPVTARLTTAAEWRASGRRWSASCRPSRDSSWCTGSPVGEWSHECVGARWLGASSAAVPGARFRGRNRAGIFRRGRVCAVTSAEPHERMWRTVPTAVYPDSSEWGITLAPIDGGTRISQQFRVLRAPKVLSVVSALLIPAHRDRTAALRDDLRRPGTVARQTPAPHADLG